VAFFTSAQRAFWGQATILARAPVLMVRFLVLFAREPAAAAFVPEMVHFSISQSCDQSILARSLHRKTQRRDEGGQGGCRAYMRANEPDDQTDDDPDN